MDDRTSNQAPGPAEGAPVRRRSPRPPSRSNFSAGHALSNAFAFYGRQFVFVFLVSAVLFAPLALYRLSVSRRLWDTHGHLGDLQRAEGFLGRILELGLPILLQALLTLAVFQYLQGRKIQHGRSIGEGLARFLSVLGVSIFTGLILFLVGMVAAIPLIAIVGSGGGAGATAGIVLGIAMIAVMFLVYCVFFVAVQAAVVERVGPSRAMSRSSWLTKGARWKIFGILLLIGIVQYVAQEFVPDLFISQYETFGDVRLLVLVTLGIAAVFAGFQAVAAAVVYHDLRRDKEGVNVEDLLQVFD